MGDGMLGFQERAGEFVCWRVREVMIHGWRVVGVWQNAVTKTVNTATEEEFRSCIQSEPRDRILEIYSEAFVETLFHLAYDFVYSGVRHYLILWRRGVTYLYVGQRSRNDGSSPGKRKGGS